MKIKFADGWQIELDDTKDALSFFYILDKEKDGVAVIDLDEFCKMLDMKNEWYTVTDRWGRELLCHDAYDEFLSRTRLLHKNGTSVHFYRCASHKKGTNMVRLELHPRALRVIYQDM